MNPQILSLYAFACAGLVALVAGLVLKKRAGVYSYDVTESYNYDFEGTDAVVSQVELVDGRVRLPAVGDGRQTAFLKVEVNVSLLGRYVDPRVEIRARDRAEVQYFERGAKGTRYINISSFLGINAVEIVLKGHHVDVNGRHVELVYFKNKIPEKPTVLVIAPHPDDAEIAAYGFYNEIKDAYIITITAGDSGNYNYNKLYSNDAEHFLKKGELRSWNSITVPMLCGIPPERSINLGFFDDMLEEMFKDQERDVCGCHTQISDIDTFRKLNLSSMASILDGTSNWKSLVGNLARLLERIKPDIILTPHPVLDSLDMHRFSTIALIEALKKAGQCDGKLFMYANHHEFNHLIPYGPMGSSVSLPPEFSGELYFSSIYSHPLSPEKQRDKIFSLEAMSDLRLATNRHMCFGTTMSALKAPLKSALGFDDSYYRRAVRSNELFFVVEINELYDNGKMSRLTGESGERQGNIL